VAAAHHDRRPVGRALRDPHLLLAAAVVPAVLAAAAIAGSNHLAGLVALSAAVVAVELILGRSSVRFLARPSNRHTIRLLVMLVFVGAANALIGEPGMWPLPALFLPVVALAAGLGRREAVWVSAAAAVLTSVPLLFQPAAHNAQTVERAIALFVAGGLLIVGTRRTVTALEGSLGRARRLLAADRRRSNQMAAVDDVGRMLARSGPTGEVLDRIMHLFERRLGYRFVSIYLGDDERVRMGAQVGYETPIHEFDQTMGVTGRTMRTHELQFIPDVGGDPDYRSAQPVVGSEICAPLLAGDEFLGTINVESDRALDDGDVATVRLVADRVAAALALARERDALAERATVFQRLTGFATAITGTLELDALAEAMVTGVAVVMDCPTVAVSVLDRIGGQYILRAGIGFDPRHLGTIVELGVGMAGRAIQERALVVDEAWDRAPYQPVDAEAEGWHTPLASVAIPLIRDDLVIGALTLVRPVERPFSTLEHEALRIVAGHGALALSNAALLAQVTESSLRDPLTGLYNRRFLDATLERMDAVRARQEPEEQSLASAILFDLDHFGELNKRHGHQVGDTVLRGFADVLRSRLRASDIVARYGGEEFLVVLEGASREETLRVADAVRRRFGALRFDGAGERVAVTVSAGVAGTGDGVASLSALVRVADAGLAMAKRGGRDQVVAV
jgi:diguanylate cyclase (GGDEF)-like protein